jgi:hypothetical protein
MTVDESLLLLPFTGGDFRVDGIRPLARHRRRAFSPAGPLDPSPSDVRRVLRKAKASTALSLMASTDSCAS